MLGNLARLVAALLIGLVVFVLAAMGLAFAKRRDVPPQEPDADEVDLVASFGPLDYKSTSSAFRDGGVSTMIRSNRPDACNSWSWSIAR